MVVPVKNESDCLCLTKILEYIKGLLVVSAFCRELCLLEEQ